MSRAVFLIVMSAAFVAGAVATAGAEVLACAAMKDARADNRNTDVHLRISNQSGQTLRVIWIDEKGKRHDAGALGGQPLDFATYDSFPWFVIDANKACVCGVTVLADDNEWTIGKASCPLTVVPHFDKTETYTPRDVAGWQVLVSKHYADNPKRLTEVVDRLRDRLEGMKTRLPGAAHAALSGTKIWLELSDTRYPGGVYHPSAEALAARGMNQEKVRSVQFTQEIAEWSKEDDQPAMVLHEFAHAYHTQVLGDANADVIGMYARACKDKLYLNGKYKGQPVAAAYALLNPAEFFAELSEAYYWHNDYSPYEKGDLITYDPTSAQLIDALWNGKGAPPSITAPAVPSCYPKPKAPGR